MTSQEESASLAPVCPRCGARAESRQFCASCGLNLRLQGELPTAEQFAASEREKQWIAAQEARQKVENEALAAKEAESSRIARQAEVEAQAARGAEIAREENRRRAQAVEARLVAAETRSDPPPAGRKSSPKRRQAAVVVATVLVIAAAVGLVIGLGSGSEDEPAAANNPATSTTVAPASTREAEASTSGDTGTACEGLEDPTPLEVEVTGAGCEVAQAVAEKAVAELQTKPAFDVAHEGREYSCEPAPAKDAILSCFSEEPRGNVGIYLRDAVSSSAETTPNADEPSTSCGTVESPEGTLTISQTTRRGNCATAKAAFEAYFESDDRRAVDPGYPVTVAPASTERTYACVEATTGQFAYICGADEGAESYGANLP